MQGPSVPPSVWIVAALDPVLIAVAVYLGFKADQLGKLFIAAIAAFAVAVLVSWAIAAAGLPWPAPIARDRPILLPVRALAALAWAAVGYLAQKVNERR